MNWFEKIKKWYEQGYWTQAMVQDAVAKDKISREEASEITGG